MINICLISLILLVLNMINFQEFIGIIRYQPFPKWYVYAQAIYFNHGLDSANKNFGGNIFKDYRTRSGEDGFKVAGGRKATGLNGLLQVSYEWKENLFFDVSMLYRNYKIQNIAGQSNTTMITAGIRINMFKRNYDF